MQVKIKQLSQPSQAREEILSCKSAELSIFPSSIDWPAIIAEWEKDPIPQKNFCKLKNINYAKFVYYKSKRDKQRKFKNTLLPVKVETPRLPSNQTSPHFILLQPNGVRLLIPMNVEEKHLKLILLSMGEK